MNINIALSTVFYIMVFIFPGIIFRKFYFCGSFTRQFSQGNIFERFILTLFFSIISISLSVGVILFFRYILEIRFLNSISYKTVINILNNIKSEKIPDEFKTNTFDFLVLASLIYAISAFLGALLHSLVVIFKLDIIFPVFRFNHPWHYIVTGKTMEKIKDKKYLYTNVDVLINDGYKNTMFSGVLYDILLEKGTNKVESILVKDCYKYHFPEENSKEYEKKLIPGSVMCFSRENIVNFNLTHVIRDKDYRTIKMVFQLSSLFIFFFLVIYSILSPWMDSEYLFFDLKIYGILKKITFTISSIFILSILYGNISEYFFKEKATISKEEETDIWAETIFFLCMFISVFLWSIGMYKWWHTFIVFFIFCLLVSGVVLFIKKCKKIILYVLQFFQKKKIKKDS